MRTSIYTWGGGGGGQGLGGLGGGVKRRKRATLIKVYRQADSTSNLY